MPNIMSNQKHVFHQCSHHEMWSTNEKKTMETLKNKFIPISSHPKINAYITKSNANIIK